MSTIILATDVSGEMIFYGLMDYVMQFAWIALACVTVAIILFFWFAHRRSSGRPGRN